MEWSFYRWNQLMLILYTKKKMFNINGPITEEWPVIPNAYTCRKFLGIPLCAVIFTERNSIAIIFIKL